VESLAQRERQRCLAAAGGAEDEDGERIQGCFRWDGGYHSLHQP
jgi:hypothetical protein